MPAKLNKHNEKKIKQNRIEMRKKDKNKTSE